MMSAKDEAPFTKADTLKVLQSILDDTRLLDPLSDKYNPLLFMEVVRQKLTLTGMHKEAEEVQKMILKNDPSSRRLERQRKRMRQKEISSP